VLSDTDVNKKVNVDEREKNRGRQWEKDDTGLQSKQGKRKEWGKKKSLTTDALGAAYPWGSASLMAKRQFKKKGARGIEATLELQ